MQDNGHVTALVVNGATMGASKRCFKIEVREGT